LLAFPLIAVRSRLRRPLRYPAPSCGGYRATLSQPAIQNVDNNGSVIVLANIADNIGNSYGKTGVTVRGNTPTITIGA
jgi:hypothetical protein